MRASILSVTLFVGINAALSPALATTISAPNPPASSRPRKPVPVSRLGVGSERARAFISFIVDGAKPNVANILGITEQLISVEEFRSEIIGTADEEKNESGKSNAFRNRMFPNDPLMQERLMPIDGPIEVGLRKFQQRNSNEFYSVNYIELRSAEIELRHTAVAVVLLDRLAETVELSEVGRTNVQNLILALESAVDEMTSNADDYLEKVADPREREHMQKNYLAMFENLLAPGSAAWNAALRTGNTNFETRRRALISDKFQIARAKINASSDASAARFDGSPTRCADLFKAGLPTLR